MKSMINVANATTIDANVVEGMTSNKTKSLVELYAQTGVFIKETFPYKENFNKESR